MSHVPALSKVEEASRMLLAFKQDIPHVERVRILVLSLFDQLQPFHGGGPDEREWLECATLLHDIGWIISNRCHHKHALRLILHHEFQTLSNVEQRIIANVARYHRRSLPQQSHVEFSKLRPEHQQTVRHLAALLRVADALDKSHQGRVSQVRCTLEPPECRLLLTASGPCDAEFKALKKKKKLFELLFRCRLETILADAEPAELVVSSS